MSLDSVKTEPGIMQNLAQFVSGSSEKEVSTKSFTLKWVNDKVVDVFRGNGWENWSRFEKRGNHYKMVAGQPLTSSEYMELKDVAAE